MRTLVSKTLDVLIIQRVRTLYHPESWPPRAVSAQVRCARSPDSRGLQDLRDAGSETHAAVGYHDPRCACHGRRSSSSTTTVVGPSSSSQRRGYHHHVVTIVILIVLAVIRRLCLLPGGDRREALLRRRWLLPDCDKSEKRTSSSCSCSPTYPCRRHKITTVKHFESYISYWCALQHWNY